MKAPNYRFEGKKYEDYLQVKTLWDKIKYECRVFKIRTQRRGKNMKLWWETHWFDVVEFFHFW